MLSLSQRFSQNVQTKLGRYYCVIAHCTAELCITIVVLKIDVIVPRSRRYCFYLYGVVSQMQDLQITERQRFQNTGNFKAG